MKLDERCALYAAAFPDWPAPRVEHGRIYGTWAIGNNYRSTGGIYGSYPPKYVERVLSMFPGFPRMMHLFSGSMGPGPWCRVDAVRPCDCAEDAQNLPPWMDGQFDLILADPPYSKEDAKKYGFKMPDRRKVIRECARVLKPGGWLVWLDCMWPPERRDTWHLRAHITVIRSQMHRVRLVTMLEKR